MSSIANELITRGWCQHSYQEPDGRVCLVGALAASLGLTEEDVWYPRTDFRRGLSALGAVIPNDSGDQSIDVTRWNDHGDRTYDEVLRVAKWADEIMDALQ